MYKNIFEGKKAVIFNLNSAVASNTHTFKKEAVSKVLKEIGYGYINPEPYCVRGYPFKTIWEAILLGNDISKSPNIGELEKKTIEKYTLIVKNSDIEVQDGFWDIVYEFKEEKKMKLALISDFPRETDTHTINKAEISELFDVYIFADDVKKPKPNPEVYKKTLKALGTKAKDALAFEDSVPGVKSAGVAKIDTLVLWDGVTRKRLYRGKVLNMSLDFSTYVGNLDKTHLEYIAESCKGALEDKKRR